MQLAVLGLTADQIITVGKYFLSTINNAWDKQKRNLTQFMFLLFQYLLNSSLKRVLIAHAISYSLLYCIRGNLVKHSCFAAQHLLLHILSEDLLCHKKGHIIYMTRNKTVYKQCIYRLYNQFDLHRATDQNGNLSHAPRKPDGYSVSTRHSPWTTYSWVSPSSVK